MQKKVVVFLGVLCVLPYFSGCTLTRAATQISAAPFQLTKEEKMNELMDKTGWRTFCAGRYAVDFPTQYQTLIDYDRVFFFRNVPLKRLKEVDSRAKLKETIQQYVRKLNEQYEDPILQSYRGSLRPDGKKNVIRTVEYPNGGIGILAYNPRLDSSQYKILYSLLVVDNPFRVYAMRDESAFDTEEESEAVIARHQTFAKQLRGREDHSVPTGNVLCIDGGFIEGDTEHFNETINMRVELPYYGYDQHKEYKVKFVLVSLPETNTPRTYPPIEDVDKRTLNKVFRNNMRSIAGRDGYETAFMIRRPYEEKVPEYMQYWIYPGEVNSSLNTPFTVGMYLLNDYVAVRPAKQHPHYIQFSDESEVLALWDAILSTVRRIPTQPNLTK